MKILFILPHLSFGGAQRVAVNLINKLPEEYVPSLFLINAEGPLLDYLKKDIEIIYATGTHAKDAVFELRNLIIKNNYDLAFTMKGYLGLVVALALSLSRTKTPLVYREVIHQSSSSLYEKVSWLKRHFRKKYLRYVYRKASMVIVPSNEMVSDLASNYKIGKEKIRVIHNPVDYEEIQNKSAETVEHGFFNTKVPVVVGMGRLTRQKDFYTLIKAVKLVNDEGTQVRLALIGEGEEKEKLHKLVIDLGVEKEVVFLGFQENPYKYIARADIFVLSSFYEGFPNSLLEAMACGVPVISTNCSSGPAEIINHYENGILIPVGNSRAIADKINDILQNQPLAMSLSLNAKNTVMDKYSLCRVIKEYEKVFELAYKQ